MKVGGLTVDPYTNTPIVLLKDLEEKDVVPIWIGFFEASAIATQLEEVKLVRPMTHDLLRNILDILGAQVLRVEVTDLRENTFYALIHIELNGAHYAIDSRPSDAIALALRTGSPIFVNEEVIEKSRKVELRSEEERDLDELLEKLDSEEGYKM
ncbi:MAG: bifunctional nuclease family protein [Deltaproteobacteria bacterium]|nr:MAG: bifunctional nuclease family protein [Deltaproteobacteria bacterium]